ncbi:hypothetical protein ODZ84_08205 [Chryseobacterium fluminis]|uniref:hypothetical protein n=1 Tax=Chryseobacterium fluminis TaxID=2983606 RepID=UPI0022574ED8|nr:hypothetical protein [Chryseobacterium sp. MMS21-Ot14]UZT99531.1 hypothetical protein ODZ84_08205 [Chryseobacterium sp. MMS21-Ot14]
MTQPKKSRISAPLKISYLDEYFRVRDRKGPVQKNGSVKQSGTPKRSGALESPTVCPGSGRGKRARPSI